MNRPSMDSKDCSELGASELSDDVQDSSLIGGPPNQPAQFRCMKLSVGTRCSPDLIVKLLHLRLNGGLARGLS